MSTHLSDMTADQWFWLLMSVAFLIPFTISFFGKKRLNRKRLDAGDICIDDLKVVSKKAQRKNGKPIIVKMRWSGVILTHKPAGFAGRIPGLGVISAQSVCDDLVKIGTCPEIKAVFITLTTPGGSPTASQMIGDAILELRRLGKQVFVYVEEMSASGGVWLMVHADKVVIHPLSLTGSIGVRGPTVFEYTGVTEQGSLLSGQVRAEAITPHLISAGRGKQFGNPYAPFDPEDAEHLSRIIDQTCEDFLGVIERNRPLIRMDDIRELGARIMSAGRSIALGLTDLIGNEGEALTLLRTLLGDANPDGYAMYTLTPQRQGVLKKLLESHTPILPVGETKRMIDAELKFGVMQAISPFVE